MWWLINLSNDDPKDIFSFNTKAKVILWENANFVDDKLRTNLNDQSILEFEGLASINPRFKEKYKQIYNNLLNKN
jgi:hypothetical protein